MRSRVGGKIDEGRGRDAKECSVVMLNERREGETREERGGKVIWKVVRGR